MALLTDGFKTIITIGGVSAVFEEIEVTPPALDAGGPISQTTMRNTRWRTALGKRLATLGKLSVKVAYDAKAYAQIVPILGSNRAVTVTFPDNSTLVFYAIVDKFTPDALKEGERPEATLDLEPSNMSTANPPVEIVPVFSTGTTTSTTTTALP